MEGCGKTNRRLPNLEPQNDEVFGCLHDAEFIIRQTAAAWLPGLDSNQDKLDQNQLCYHYTTGQVGGNPPGDGTPGRTEL